MPNFLFYFFILYPIPHTGDFISGTLQSILRRVHWRCPCYSVTKKVQRLYFDFLHYEPPNTALNDLNWESSDPMLLTRSSGVKGARAAGGKRPFSISM